MTCGWLALAAGRGRGRGRGPDTTMAVCQSSSTPVVHASRKAAISSREALETVWDTLRSRMSGGVSLGRIRA